MMAYNISVSNRAGDLAQLMPMLQRVSKGVAGIKSGTFTVKETVPGTFCVSNAHTGHSYVVQYYEKAGVWTCDCPDFRYRNIPLCKHIVAVWQTKGLVNDAGIPHSCELPF